MSSRTNMLKKYIILSMDEYFIAKKEDVNIIILTSSGWVQDFLIMNNTYVIRRYLTIKMEIVVF